MGNNDNRLQPQCNYATREQYGDTDANGNDNNTGSSPSPHISDNSPRPSTLDPNFDTGFKAY